jgi:N-acetylneuraminate synthase
MEITMIGLKNLTTPYFIGEIGINHNGDMQIAKRLMDGVSACGWNCAKFQKRTPDICVPENQKSVIRQTPWGVMTYLEYKYRVEFEKEEYDTIDLYCKQKPIDWTASVWDVKSLEFLLQYDIPFIKIPSAMATDDVLLAEVAKTGKTLMISTGMSTLDEVDHALKIIEKYGVEPIIMHTNSSYPTPIDELNLRLIPMLKKRYKCTIGYSGHEEGLEPSVIAVALGAKFIERHITLSHKMWGSDHKSSLELHAMDMLRKRVIGIDKMLGSDEKKLTPSEVKIREKLRKV